MADNPIVKTIKRHVHGRWAGYPGLNAAHSATWTVGRLEQIVADCYAAGYDSATELRAEVGRPGELAAFALALTEDIAEEIPVRS